MIKLKDFKNAEERAQFLEQQLGITLPAITNSVLNESELVGRNIENLIGATQIPLGVAGPLLIRGFKNDFYIPLATTEGALVASVSRGCKAISESGAATVEIENVGITRGPVFKAASISHSIEIKSWAEQNFSKLQKVAAQTSNHLKLLKVESTLIGKRVYLRFSYNTADAMGMNMVTIATEQIAKVIESETKATLLAVAGNFDIDKKPSWMNFILGRGRKVNAEVVLTKEVLQEVLKTTAEKVYEVVINKTLIGSAISGSIGFNSHYANIIASIFAATGQDLAHVVEGSLGITTAEVLENGDLYLSIYLPSLVIGTVGGGTPLPTQQEALKIMGVAGSGKADLFATIIGAAVLAGEISLLSSLSQGTLASAHIKHGRKGQ